MRPIPSPFPRSSKHDEEYQRQLEALAASLDAAEEELARKGPVSQERLAEMLRDQERDWSKEDAASSRR